MCFLVVPGKADGFPVPWASASQTGQHSKIMAGGRGRLSRDADVAHHSRLCLRPSRVRKIDHHGVDSTGVDSTASQEAPLSC